MIATMSAQNANSSVYVTIQTTPFVQGEASVRRWVGVPSGRLSRDYCITSLRIMQEGTISYRIYLPGGKIPSGFCCR